MSTKYIRECMVRLEYTHSELLRLAKVHHEYVSM